MVLGVSINVPLPEHAILREEISRRTAENMEVRKANVIARKDSGAKDARNALLEAEFTTGGIMVAAASAADGAGAAIPAGGRRAALPQSAPAAAVPSPCAQRLVPAEQAVRRLH